MTNEEKIAKLTRQVGAAKKKIETLKKELEAEKAKGEAYEQLQDINMAMITAIVRNLGEVKVKQEEINEVLNAGIQCMVGYDAETMEYTLRVSAKTEE